LRKRPLLILAVLVCGLVPAAPAQAGGLLSGVLPGLVSPSDTPATCDGSASQPFKRWGDNNYVLLPGGSFEPGSAAWKLSGGAKIVYGNEPFYVRSSSDCYSLYLPYGSTVTTPPMCFKFTDWHLRFFSSGSGTVRVKIVVKSLLGILSVLGGGTVSSGSSWRPSPEVGLLLTNLGGLLATDSISLRISPANTSGVRIDDFYLDPWKSG
jgi:hypothetical protein